MCVEDSFFGIIIINLSSLVMLSMVPLSIYVGSVDASVSNNFPGQTRGQCYFL